LDGLPQQRAPFAKCPRRYDYRNRMDVIYGQFPTVER
jgi:hypothetical protein